MCVFLNICSTIQKISNISALTFHRPPLLLVFSSLCSSNSCFSSPNFPAAKILLQYFWAILIIFFGESQSARKCRKTYPAKENKIDFSLSLRSAELYLNWTTEHFHQEIHQINRSKHDSLVQIPTAMRYVCLNFHKKDFLHLKYIYKM